ncbi:unnamed protein product [Lymnaea stagnalis]|uniref:Uncharacterized protein n=1 Tax=Lymnaea stagnalis TaxID=6523 RepID=A0AAV2I2H8_LYMST
MARLLCRILVLYTSLFNMVQTWVLQLILVVTALAERCTKAVPVKTYPENKVTVLRRVPATCSNWDKAWAWLTKTDCGTKYRLDHVTLPPREVKLYKLEYGCCDGDTDCNEAKGIHSSGFDSTDEKFLAIVLGSTAACVIIVIIIFAITFYTKKTRCYSLCDPSSHIYASAADGDDSQDGAESTEKCPPEDLDSETDQKACEAEYAEIGDSRLPRYTDIFKDSAEERGDPFKQATAPPLYSEVSPKNYINSGVRTPASLHASGSDEIHVIQATSPCYCEGADDVFEGPSHHQKFARHQGASAPSGSSADSKYYNVREKKRKKKTSSGSRGGSTSSSKEERRGGERESTTSGGSASKMSSRRSKSSVPSSFEMMVKSSSASETIGKQSEKALAKQKRRSAPPDSVDVPVGVIHSVSTHSPPASVSRSFSNSTCSVIHEAPASRRASDKRQKMRSSRDSLQKTARNTSRSSEYENDSVVSPKPDPKDISLLSSYAAEIEEVTNNSVSISPSNGAVLTCCDTASAGLASGESESPLPSEKDSLLRTPSCHSGCGSDRCYEECEHCLNYDRLNYPSDTDSASIHVYQCLEDVKRERQELAAGRSPGSGGESSPTGPEVCHNGSILKEDSSLELHAGSNGHAHTAQC